MGIIYFKNPRLRKRIGRILIVAGIILLFGSLGNRAPYITFPVAFLFILLGIFWSRFSRTKVWEHISRLEFVAWLFAPEKDNNNQYKE